MDPKDRAFLEGSIKARDLLDGHRVHRPSDYYDPHDNGQHQFHCAERPMRLLFPGNGWGKTTAIAIECDQWIQHSNRWRKTPEGFVTCLWFVPEFKQYWLIQPQIQEECLTRGYKFNSGRNCYEWEGLGRLFLASADRDWTYLQGINPDLIVFDEQPPLKLWREMMMRRRGKRKTEFAIAATATQGITWMAELYQQWLDHHLQHGLDESRAIEEQLHPDIWCWPRGGIADNPGADEEDVRWYESQKWSSEKEKKVRLHGGFENWAGDPVFDEQAVNWMRREAEKMRLEDGDGQLGWFDPIYKGDARVAGRVLSNN